MRVIHIDVENVTLLAKVCGAFTEQGLAWSASVCGASWRIEVTGY